MKAEQTMQRWVDMAEFQENFVVTKIFISYNFHTMKYSTFDFLQPFKNVKTMFN